jgi:hypothetical protein
MKRVLSLLLITCLLILGVQGIADAVTPSGPGQTTAAHSVSVVFASDAPAITVSGTGLATSAKQDTAQTSLGTLVTNTTALATSALQTTANTKLDSIVTATGTTLHADVDGLETLVTATNAALQLLKQPTLSVAVTASDATDLTATCTKGLWVGTGGNLSVKLAGDSAATTWKNVPAGTYVPGAYSRVMAATTAADVVCLSGP